MTACVLVIAGSDSGGGAGIQGDIKTFTSLGGFATTAITALTAQNTQGVQAIRSVSSNLIKMQIDSIVEDFPINTIKLGMLHSEKVIKTVVSSIKKNLKHVPYILDPVMIAKSGTPLLKKNCINLIISDLIPKSLIVTPNIPEAQEITNIEIKDINDMKMAGKKILSLGAKSVLIKGGHMNCNTLSNVLVTSSGSKIFKSNRIETLHTHGTGCTMASAIAVSIAQGMSIDSSIERAQEYVIKAIQNAPKLGAGHGPLDHLAGTGSINF